MFGPFSHSAGVKTAQSKKRIKRRGKDSFEPRKTYVKGELYWQVNLPIEYKIVDGKRVKVQKRRTLRDRQVAETIAEQARIQGKNDGLKSFAIPDHVRREALAAAKELAPFGASIIEAAKFYAAHLRQQTNSEKVSAAVQELLAERQKDELSTRYRLDLRVRLNRFSQSFGERMLASITAGELNSWLRAFKAVNRNTFRAYLSVLFSYAVERGWCQQNPVAKIKKVKAVTSIGILSPEQFAKGLEAASEETLPYWLIGGFAGLRRAEIERLEWKDIRFDSGLIEVPALKSKTASRRFVKIQPSLSAWLAPYKGRSGKICPPNLQALLEIDRLGAGFKPTALGITQMKQMGIALDPVMLEGLKKWPSNGLRHSFASYHLAHFQDAARLALELGHVDQGLLFRHYRELVTPEQAAKYWSIRTPKNAKPKNVTRMAA
jgi:integrase